MTDPLDDLGCPSRHATTYRLSVYRSRADMEAGREPRALLTGIPRRDTALAMAARCLCGVDRALPAGAAVEVVAEQDYRQPGWKPWRLTRPDAEPPAVPPTEPQTPPPPAPPPRTGFLSRLLGC
jgi:hypothetical protein